MNFDENAQVHTLLFVSHFIHKTLTAIKLSISDSKPSYHYCNENNWAMRHVTGTARFIHIHAELA